MRPGLTGLIVVGSQYTVGQKMYYHRQYFNEKSKIDLPPYLSWLECQICKHANIVWTQAKKLMTCLCITPVTNSSDLSCHSVLHYDHQNWVDTYNFLIVFTRVTQANWKIFVMPSRNLWLWSLRRKTHRVRCVCKNLK